jgi:hypothetical protein
MMTVLCTTARIRLGNLPMTSEHTKGKRRSTKDKHDEGERKKAMGAGGEKGDKKRKRQQRKRQRPHDEE